MKKTVSRSGSALFEVRHSPIHGHGVFALRRIRKGTRIVEYLGDRITHEAVDERYADKAADDNHTFLFTVDKKTVIDAGVNGNDARYINHSCDPNCESEIESKRVFIDAIRTIQPGEELFYDYSIGRDADDEPNVEEIFACHCGAKECRGSMLEPKPVPKKKRKGKRAAKKRLAAKSSAGRGSGAAAAHGPGSRRPSRDEERTRGSRASDRRRGARRTARGKRSAASTRGRSRANARGSGRRG